MTPTTARPSPRDRYRAIGLAALLFVMVAYFGGEWLIDRLIQGPIEAARARRTQLERDIQQRETSLQRLREAGKLLAQWEDQSLPADTEAARSLYQAWLVELVDDVGLASPSVTSSEPVARGGLYSTISFSVRGRGTLEQLTKFLFAFYQADLLHQLRSLTITPLQRAEDLDVSFAIETLALKSAGAVGATKAAPSAPENVYEQFRRRAWRVSDRLGSGDLEAYGVIVRRNLFALGGGFEPSDHTCLTSITQVNGEPEAWFTNRATDEVVKLRAGGRLELGPLTFRVGEVLDTDVIIETDGERWLLALGDKIIDAQPLVFESGDRIAADPEPAASGEISAKVWRYAQRWVARCDADGDGKLTEIEWRQSEQGPAGDADANQDGLLTVEELAQWTTDLGRHRKIRLMPASMGGEVPLPSLLSPGGIGANREEAPGDAGRPLPADETAADAANTAKDNPQPRVDDRKYTVLPSRLPPGLPDWFLERDRDGDGQLTLAEYAESGSASADKEFARYDRNRDGLVTPQEVLAASGDTRQTKRPAAKNSAPKPEPAASGDGH